MNERLPRRQSSNRGNRNRYLVCYDVTDPRRLRNTHKKMKGFGDPVQYSVFVCELSRKEKILMEQAITEVVNLDQDSVMIVDLGPTGGRGTSAFTMLGTSRLPEERGAVVY